MIDPGDGRWRVVGAVGLAGLGCDQPGEMNLLLRRGGHGRVRIPMPSRCVSERSGAKKAGGVPSNEGMRGAIVWVVWGSTLHASRYTERDASEAA